MNTRDIKGRWKRFAEKIAEGQSATDAYLQAGYRPATREIAHRAASRLRAQPEIRDYIQNLRQTADQEAREDTALTIREKLAFLARIVKTSAAHLAEDDELIQSHRTLKDGRITTRIPCKLKALKMHSELAGHLIPVPPQPTPSLDPLQQLFDQIRAGCLLPDSVPHPITSQPEPSSKAALSPPAIKGSYHDSAGDMGRHNDFACKNIGIPRPSIAEAAHLSRNTRRPTSQVPQANAPQLATSKTHTDSKTETLQNSTNHIAAPRLPDEASALLNATDPPDLPKKPEDLPFTPTQLRKLIQAQLRQASLLQCVPTGTH